MAAGGAAGRAAGAGGPFRSWADEPTLAETLIKNATKQTPRGSMIAAPCQFWSPTHLNARAQKSFALGFYCSH